MAVPVTTREMTDGAGEGKGKGKMVLGVGEKKEQQRAKKTSLRYSKMIYISNQNLWGLHYYIPAKFYYINVFVCRGRSVIGGDVGLLTPPSQQNTPVTGQLNFQFHPKISILIGINLTPYQ